METCSRSKLKTVLIEKGAVGGQVLITSWIDNYPGFPDGLAGYDLIDKMAAQAKRFGLETITDTVTALDLHRPVKKLICESGREITTQALIISTGARPNKLGIPGEDELTGKGVSYCATCDAPFYQNMHVAVIGGGNTAIQDAIHLTRFASRVTVVHRRDKLRATQIYQDEAFANEKIDFVWNANAIKITGEKAVSGLHVKKLSGEELTLAVQGVFVFIGTIPNNEMLSAEQIQIDDRGFVVTDQEMRTSVPGVMAAGDIRSKEVRQVITAAGEGAMAEQAAEKYLGTI